MLDVKQPKILMFDVIEGKILVFSVFEIPPSRPSAKGCVSKRICDYWLLMRVRERNAV